MERLIQISRAELVEIIHQIKEHKFRDVYLIIDPDGNIRGQWYFGRSDVRLTPNLIVLPGVKEQTEEAILYAITIIIRNREGYIIVPYKEEYNDE